MMAVSSYGLTVLLVASCVLWSGAGVGGGQETQAGNTLQLTSEAQSPKATIEQVSWLAGEWRGTGLGGECEEWWGRPAGGRMQGSFRYDRAGKLVFTEHFVLAEEAGSLVLRLKHFDQEFKGWEPQAESVLFRLVEIKEGEARFEGLTYRLVGADELHVFVLIRNGEGQEREESFKFRRSSHAISK